MPGYKASSGPADVLASGTVISLNREPIKVSFGAEGHELSVVFRFLDDPKAKEDEAGVEIKEVDSQTAEITLQNFRSSVPRGSSTALRLGLIDGLGVYLHYRVQDIGTGDKTLQFTIFRLRRAAIP